MKGKVIVIDNLVDATRNMVVKNKYILAHTTDISFKRFNPNQPFPRNNNNNRADAQNNNQNANANVAANDNMNLRPNDFGSPQHAMSQIITVRDNPNRLKDVKKHLLEIMSDKAQTSQFYADHIYPS